MLYVIRGSQKFQSEPAGRVLSKPPIRSFDCWLSLCATSPSSPSLSHRSLPFLSQLLHQEPSISSSGLVFLLLISLHSGPFPCPPNSPPQSPPDHPLAKITGRPSTSYYALLFSKSRLSVAPDFDLQKQSWSSWPCSTTPATRDSLTPVLPMATSPRSQSETTRRCLAGARRPKRRADSTNPALFLEGTLVRTQTTKRRITRPATVPIVVSPLISYSNHCHRAGPGKERAPGVALSEGTFPLCSAPFSACLLSPKSPSSFAHSSARGKFRLLSFLRVLAGVRLCPSWAAAAVIFAKSPSPSAVKIGILTRPKQSITSSCLRKALLRCCLVHNLLRHEPELTFCFCSPFLPIAPRAFSAL